MSVDSLVIHPSVIIQDCADNTTGINCGECLSGFYDADLGADLVCQPCPCTTTTAFKYVGFIHDCVYT